ncbi:MAG: hypothetical protein P8X81_13165 [Woeseiaceae bacterium]
MLGIDGVVMMLRVSVTEVHHGRLAVERNPENDILYVVGCPAVLQRR